MKLTITANLTGEEIQDFFIKQLNENKIEPDAAKIKFVILNKQNQEVEVGADKIKLVYSNE